MDAINKKFVMEVRPGGITRRANRANSFALANMAAFLDKTLCEVQVFGGVLPAVLNNT